MLSAYLDGRVFGEEFGPPPPWALALHGWQRTRGDFVAVCHAGDGMAALAIDLPGFGDSPEPPAAWGATDYAAALAPLVDQLVGGVVLIGHSFGGRVAVELAAARPERVRALVLCGVPLVNAGAQQRRPKLQYRAIRWLAARRLIPAARLEEARQRFGSYDYRVARGVVRDVLVRVVAEDYRDTLSRIECPVELVWGELDTVVPIDVARAAQSFLPSANLTVLPGIGHLVPIEAAHRLREIVLAHKP